jgi:hypothetical protein
MAVSTSHLALSAFDFSKDAFFAGPQFGDRGELRTFVIKLQRSRVFVVTAILATVFQLVGGKPRTHFACTRGATVSMYL